LCYTRLKSFVESDRFMKEPEMFEKLLNEYAQSLISMLDRISFLTSVLY
jgi:hypothetical protein